MKILILNWRDIKNPSSGGAEILTHEIAKYLVKKNNEVILFTSRFEGSKPEEMLDGIKIIRRGHSVTRHILQSVYFLAFKEYKKYFEGQVDLVIDEAHGLPFFTPFYVKEKKITLVCEVAGNLWFKVFGILFGTLGWIIEKFCLRIIYKGVPFITISESAKRSLIKNGVNEKVIEVIPVGFSFPKQVQKKPKEKKPTLIFLSRIAKSKGVEDAIYALDKLKNFPDIQLWIVGKGDKKYVENIKNLIKEVGLKDKVTFYDYVSEQKKFELLSRAWILIHPSKTEGWGINVIEANVVGTPAIGYNVPGLKDSIQNNKTGLLTDINSIDDFSKKIVLLLKNKEVYKRLSKEAVVWSDQFSWENAGEKTWKIIKRLYEKKN